MNEPQFCTVEDRGHLRIVTLNRPEVANALHSEASHELEAVWNDFAADDNLWVGIITGTGDRAFSAGNDLKVQAAGKRGPRPKTGFGGLAHRLDCYKPIIAAVNGFAVGGGFELALACDLIIASTNAFFSLPEPRIGMMAAGGGVQRLPQIIAQKQAMGILLTGRRVTAEEGFQLGFVNEVVPEGEALDAAIVWAEKILECAPIAVRSAKQAAYTSLDAQSLEEAWQLVAPIRSKLMESEDYIEGPKAFSEKRKPAWKNR